MMQRILALSFTYQEKEYSALVRVTATFPETILRVTIMNGELEQRFFPYNTFCADDSGIFPVNPASKHHIAALQQTIAMEINAHWKLNQRQPAYSDLADN